MLNKKIVLTIGTAILFMPLLFYAWRISLRPPRTEIDRQLSSGINYQRKIYSQPRPYIAHIVSIDLSDSKIEAFVTPIASQLENEYSALTTSNFVRQFDLRLAVNGSFFYPFAEDTPWSYYPRQGEKAIALGENIIGGKRYGKAEEEWNVICFQANRAEISLIQRCPELTQSAVAGRELLVKDGKAIEHEATKAYARTAVGVDRQGKKIWLIVVDGKQPFYSEGATLDELAQIAIDLDCDRAINLDGGGSSTLAVRQGKDVKVLNAPIHTKIPLKERPVANHLGFK